MMAFLDQLIFLGVRAGLDDSESDSILIEAAKKSIWKKEKDKYCIVNEFEQDRNKSCWKLLERYNAAGFKVGIIHSNREDSENLCVINEVKAGNLMD